MKQKFNPKIYLSKDRVYQSLMQYPGVSKLWIWDKEKKEYTPPRRGKMYLNRKRIFLNGKKLRVQSYFDSLDEALSWEPVLEDSFENLSIDSSMTPKKAGITFGQVVDQWHRTDFPKLKFATKDRYQQLLGRYFVNLRDVQMSTFDSKTVDRWIESLMALPRTSRRFNFKYELDLLSTLLRFYAEHTEGFVSPIKKRHRKAIVLKIMETPKKKDLTEAELQKFLIAIKKLKNGPLLSVLATLQFYQALRISEAAAIHWEDVLVNETNVSKSRIHIRRSLKWPRVAKSIPMLENNFKNSRTNYGVKEQPLFKESYRALQELGLKKAGPIFQVDNKFLNYRQLQSAFDTALKNAGIENCRGTHIMRHGGCRKVYNLTGDLAVAKQILGNTSLKSVAVYAVRDTSALDEVAQKSWDAQ